MRVIYDGYVSTRRIRKISSISLSGRRQTRGRPEAAARLAIKQVNSKLGVKP
jgi:hypothetical protein